MRRLPLVLLSVLAALLLPAGTATASTPATVARTDAGGGPGRPVRLVHTGPGVTVLPESAVAALPGRVRALPRRPGPTGAD